MATGSLLFVYNATVEEPPAAIQPFPELLGSVEVFGDDPIAAAVDPEGILLFAVCDDAFLYIVNIRADSLSDISLNETVSLLPGDNSALPEEPVIYSMAFDASTDSLFVGAEGGMYVIEIDYERSSNGSYVKNISWIDLEMGARSVVVDYEKGKGSECGNEDLEGVVYMSGRSSTLVRRPTAEVQNSSSQQEFSFTVGSDVPLFAFYSMEVDPYRKNDQGNRRFLYLGGGLYNTRVVRFFLDCFRASPPDECFESIWPDDFGVEMYGRFLTGAVASEDALYFGSSNLDDFDIGTNGAEVIMLSASVPMSGEPGEAKFLRMDVGDSDVSTGSHDRNPVENFRGSVYFGTKTRPPRVIRIDLDTLEEAYASHLLHEGAGYFALSSFVDDVLHLLFFAMAHGPDKAKSNSHPGMLEDSYESGSLVVMDVKSIAAATSVSDPCSYSVQSFPGGLTHSFFDENRRIVYWAGGQGNDFIVRFPLPPDGTSDLFFEKGGVNRDQFGYQKVFLDPKQTIQTGVMDSEKTRKLYLLSVRFSLIAFDLEKSTFETFEIPSGLLSQPLDFLHGIISWPHLYFGSSEQILRWSVLNMTDGIEVAPIREDASAEGSSFLASALCRVYFTSPHTKLILSLATNNFTVPANSSSPPSYPLQEVIPAPFATNAGVAMHAISTPYLLLARPASMSMLARMDIVEKGGPVDPVPCCYSTCISCVADSNCGWCHARKQCMPGSGAGPSEPLTCVANKNDTEWSYGKCSTNVCYPACNHGSCMSVVYAADFCECDPSYSGVSCDIPVCGCRFGWCSNVALSNCTCWDGWKGPKCVEAHCAFDCENGGTCDAPGHCRCASGWTGRTCTNAICSDYSCEHGFCDGPNYCSCDRGWEGDHCDKSSRHSNVVGILLATIVPSLVVVFAVLIAIWYLVYRFRSRRSEYSPNLSVQGGTEYHPLKQDPEDDSLYLVEEGGYSGLQEPEEEKEAEDTALLGTSNVVGQNEDGGALIFNAINQKEEEVASEDLFPNQ